MIKKSLRDELQQELGECEYLLTFRAGLPMRELQLEVRVLAKERLSPLREVTLRAIQLGVGSVSAIALVLGVGRAVVTSTISFLLSLDLVQGLGGTANGEEEQFELSERGRQALLDLALRRTAVESLRCVYDALTGEVQPKRVRQRFKTVDGAAGDGIRAMPLERDVGDESSLSKEQVREVLEEHKRVDLGQRWEGVVLEVQKVDARDVQYRAVDIAVFLKGDAYIVRVLDRGVRLRRHEVILQRLVEEDRGVLPIEIAPAAGDRRVAGGLLTKEEARAARENAEVVADLQNSIERVNASVEGVPSGASGTQEGESTREQLVAAQKTLQELRFQLEKQLEDMSQGFRLIDTEEIREHLLRALKHARTQIIIISPWLNFRVVDGEFKKLFDAAIGRGVEIVIGWGYPEERSAEGIKKNEMSSAVASELLERAQAAAMGAPQSKHLGRARIVKLGNTHQKILVSARKRALVGSYNFLSYKASKRVGEPALRAESSFLVQYEPKVVEIAEKVLEDVRLAEARAGGALGPVRPAT